MRRHVGLKGMLSFMGKKRNGETKIEIIEQDERDKSKLSIE